MSNFGDREGLEQEDKDAAVMDEWQEADEGGWWGGEVITTMNGVFFIIRVTGKNTHSKKQKHPPNFQYMHLQYFAELKKCKTIMKFAQNFGANRKVEFNGPNPRNNNKLGVPE